MGLHETLESVKFLQLLQQTVIESPSLTDEVRDSTEKIIKLTRILIRNTAIVWITEAIQNDFFGVVAESAAEIYNFDQNLFKEIFRDIFKNIADDDSFKQIMESLKYFKECGPIVDAYCVLFEFESYNCIIDNLFGLESAVNKLLRNTDLASKEADKLRKLLDEIDNFYSRHLEKLAIVSNI